MAGDQTQEALHNEREWLRVTLSSIGDAVITTDTNGRVTFMNPVAQSVTGWKLSEASGLPLEQVFRIINEESRQTVDSPVTHVLRQGLVVGLANHTLLIARDGTERPIDDSAAPIRNARGEIAGVVLVFRDVTERRKAERELRDSEERFRLLVEGTRDYAIFMLDRGGHIASWNPGAERIKGYKAEEIIGRDFSCFYPAEAVERGWPQEELRRAEALGRFEDEGWRVRKDGTTFWANVVITALRDEAGKLRGFSKITRDLTQRRQLERAKLQAELMADLNRRKDEFLAMLSHELRNPLAPILNALQLLRLQKYDDAVGQQSRAIIERQVEKLTRLVDDLLEVSRITTGRVRLQQENVDLRGLVERAVETLRHQIQQRKHELTVSVPSQAVWLFADATRIEQVLVNLLGNAAKYTPEGGKIYLTLECEGQEAILRVRDTGIGIAEEFLPTIFELFTQADKSLDRSQGGLGVGLSVVQRVVAMHGGKVEAHSAGLGQGSEFIVRLPLASPPAPVPSRAAGPDQAPAPGTRRLRVLVVDDNKDSADTTALLLQSAGHDVRVAYAGVAALESARSFQPDAVLLDLGLPELDGYEIARRLRKQSQFTGTLLVAISGYGQDADKEKSRAAGFDTHLIKPAKMADIEQLLAGLARRSGKPG